MATISTSSIPNEAIIDLNAYRAPNSRVFIGRPRGKEVREKSKIDVLIKKHEFIKIIIPKEIQAINPSFLEEFLLNPVKFYGNYERFRAHVEFDVQGVYEGFEEHLAEAVDRILSKENALP